MKYQSLTQGVRNIGCMIVHDTEIAVLEAKEQQILKEERKIEEETKKLLSLQY